MLFVSTSMSLEPESSIVEQRPLSEREARRRSQRTLFDARQRLTSTTGTRTSYDYELLREYATSRISSALAIPALVIILGAFASFWVPLYLVLSWAGLVTAANFGVVLVCKRFIKVEEKKFVASTWTTSFVAAETVYGVAWAMLALFNLASGGPELQVVVFAMMLIGVSANALTSRTFPVATLMSTLPATLTVGINLIVTGSTLSFALAAIAVGAQFFFLYLSRQTQNIELASFALQSEKDALILDLEDARQSSDLARNEAEQANIAKSRFLATMSHELRTPLNAIIGFSEVLKSELLGPHAVPQYKEYAGDIHTSGQHLLNLINELLDLSRIEAGKYDLNEEIVYLHDIADDSLRMMQIRAKSKGVELLVEIEEGLPKIWGDERSIRQVVLNLLTNAIKVTPQGGQITLTISQSADGGQLISVKDNGPGIPEDEIATVLSSFGQGSLAQKTAEQGAGLGLPIVQKIMNLHQGRFDLFSKLRFGTEAIATFPRARVMGALAPVVEDPAKLKIF